MMIDVSGSRELVQRLYRSGAFPSNRVVGCLPFMTLASSMISSTQRILFVADLFNESLSFLDIGNLPFPPLVSNPLASKTNAGSISRYRTWSLLEGGSSILAYAFTQLPVTKPRPIDDCDFATNLCCVHHTEEPAIESLGAVISENEVGIVRDS